MTHTKETTQTVEQGKLGIERLYIKEQSCKVPYAPGIYQSNVDTKPETNLEMNIKNHGQTEHQIEVILTLNLTMKLAQQTALIMEVQQAGLFRLEGFTQTQQAYLLGAYCPGVLFSYARKAVTDLATSAGFAAITLPPINFDQLYQQQLQNAQAQKSSSAESDATMANETMTIQ